MNLKLIATLAALAIAAPTMGCAHDTDTPEQQDGLKKDAVQGEANKDQQTTDQKPTQDDKKDLGQQTGNSCEPAGGGLESNPYDPCGGAY